METRILKQEEVLDALHLIWAVFAESVAPSYSKEGVEEFQRFIKYENVRTQMQQQKLIFFGSFLEGKMCGASAMDSYGHVRLLFVQSQFQKQGMGSRLLLQMKNYASHELKVSIVQVNAAPQALAFYQTQGFCVTGEETIIHGVRFVPMQCAVIAGEKSGGSSKTILIGVIAVAAVLLLIILLLCGVLVVKKVASTDLQSGAVGRFRSENGMDDYIFGEEKENPDSDTGIHGIEDYEGENLSYSIKEETYQKQEQKGKNNIDFQVAYPVLQNLPTDQADVINQAIQDCAMKTVNQIYLTPSEEMKGKILAQKQTFLISYVEYKVCYEGADFISIAFNDQFYKGEIEEGTELRTLNINLKTGKIYDIKEIVDLSDTFMKEWLISAKKEAPQVTIFDEMPPMEFKKILTGTFEKQNYSNAFFVDENGIQIGFSCFGEEQNHFNGWVTAPFTYQEIKKHQTNNEFWHLIDPIPKKTEK
ncbi:MAG: GNAT family N-acetyltransferase [Lachnospiraceae bacterium]